MVCTCTIDGIDSKPDMCYNYKDIQDIWIRTYWLNMLCVYFTNLTVELHNKWIYGYVAVWNILLILELDLSQCKVPY
jgi:hypothetical protein